jgi:hypothetical protein
MISKSILAQEITGKVVDADQMPVEFATVVMQTPDSIYVTATITDTLGVFHLKSDRSAYRLVVQHLLFEPKELELSGRDAGMIMLKKKENELAEIVVKKERPLVKVEGGTFTYDLGHLTEGKAVSNAWESILQLPGVREQSGSVTLAGASRLTIILNGRPTTMSNEQLMTLLKNTPSSKIEKAEVMYSAPPQYHVRGAAINLIMKSNDAQNGSLQGEVNSSYRQKYYSGFSSGLSLAWSSARFSSDLLYSFGQDKGRTGLDLGSFHSLNGSVYSIEQRNRGYRRLTEHQVRLGMNFHLNDSDQLALVYTTELTPSFRNEETSTGNFSDSYSKRTGDHAMHNIDLNYLSGFGLSAGASYTWYNAPSTTGFQDTDQEGEQTAWISGAGQRINRIRLYLDQSHSLQKDWKLNYGTEFFYVKDHDYQKYTSLDGTDLSGSNTDSKIDEYTYNLYAGFEKSFSKRFSMSLSLSGEYYKRSGFSRWSVFPSSEMTWVFSSDHIFQFSLSSDKTYPGYWEMQESVSYLNGYAEVWGNPSLIPYKDYSAQLSYILKSKYIATAYLNYMPDYFAQLPYQSSERLALIYQTLNWNYQLMEGVNFVVPFGVGQVLKSRLTVNGFYSKVKNDHFHDLSFERDKWVIYGRMDHTIGLSSKPDLKVEAAAYYLSPSLQGIYDLSAVWSLDAGIKWTFTGKKAELKLKGTDLADSYVPDAKINYNSQHLNMVIVPDSRFVNLSFVWKFGDYTEKEHKKVDTSRFGHQ